MPEMIKKQAFKICWDASKKKFLNIPIESMKLNSNFVLFPRPKNGKPVWENELMKTREIIRNINSIIVEPTPIISDGAKNKMRIFLDTWDKELTKNMENLFENYMKPMVIGFATKQDIDSIKKFKSIEDINGLPNYLSERMLILNQKDNKEENKEIKIQEYFFIKESISALLEYRSILIKLSEKNESGIFESYFKSQIEKLLILAEKILIEKFYIMSKEIEFKIWDEIYNIISDGNKEKKNKLKLLIEILKLSNQENFLDWFENVIDVNNEKNDYNRMKGILVEMNLDLNKNIIETAKSMKWNFETMIINYFSLNDKIEELESKNKELENKNKELENQNEELKNENEELKNQNEELKDKNESQQKEINNLVDYNNLLKKENDKTKNENEKLK